MTARVTAAWLLAALAALTIFPAASFADDYTVGALTIDHPWARPSIGQTKRSAAYMTIGNGGDANDVLVSAATPVAGTVELHTHIRDGDVMKMRRVEGGIPIAANGTVELKPGGYHIMLLDLKGRLTEGEKIPMTLTFEKAGAVAIEVKIQKGKANGPHHKH